jgi:dTDP-4-amino-4,6-dideoxygalactose transaminase
MKKKYQQKNPNAYDLSSRGINLPCAFNLTNKQIELICQGIKKILNFK